MISISPIQQWKLPSKVTEDENVQFYLSSEQPPECGAGDKSTKVWQCAFLLAKNRLLDLEENIERRYIKPPLGYR